MTQPVLIDGQWRESAHTAVFHAENPQTAQMLPEEYPVSSWDDCEAAITAAVAAAEEMRRLPPERIADFLECFADASERRKNEIVQRAHIETALPVAPRLADVELPRTTNQLRQAARAAREGSWSLATIDSATNIRSYCAPLGPVIVFGPNNFPLAFGSISGGDFAAAIAAGNPVIAKANSSHPGTTQLMAEAAFTAANQTNMPAGTVQLIYRTAHDDGERLVADPRVGATGYTGSREAGLKLKAAADAAGNPIYLELSSVNPVVILPGALDERLEDIAQEFATSCLMGTGQFCTNPGLVVLLESPESDEFVRNVGRRFDSAPVGTLLSRSVLQSLEAGLQTLRDAGAVGVTGNTPGTTDNYCCANTLLKVSGAEFLGNPTLFQTEAFGNASLMVVAQTVDQLCQILEQLEGNLTGCIYSHSSTGDDAVNDRIEPILRRKVGRLLNDKMPTGVAVSPAMNHGGPFPATGHPGFTAVGVPASLRRFAMLQCYDNVRPDRLPPPLRDKNPNATMWRLIDNRWSQGDV